MNPPQLTWVQKSGGAHDDFAVHAGIDSGKELYVARADHKGGVIPGKLHLGHPAVHIPFGGEEITKAQYEVLVAPPGALSWVDCEGDKIPDNVIQGGNDPSGEPYFIGRVIHEGTVTVGKVQKSHGACYVSYGGKEHKYTKYEILVRNAYGRYLNI